MNNKTEISNVTTTEVIAFTTELACLLKGNPVVNFILWRLERKYSDNDVLPMEKCFKFKACNAPLCPIDPDLIKRTYLKSDGVCFYVRESVKQGFQPEIFAINDTVKKILDAVQLSKDLMKMIGKANYRAKLKKAAESKSKRCTNNLKLKKNE